MSASIVTPSTLLYPVLDFVQSGSRARFVERCTGRAGDADRTDHLFPEFDRQAATPENHVLGGLEGGSVGRLSPLSGFAEAPCRFIEER